MVFHYDGNGVRTHFDYAGTSVNGTYYYRYNAQGDVIALLDSTGAIVAEYDYTAYGILIHNSSMMWSSVAERNPFRYRGYYYDNETGLYYLNSRYYDAYLGRFINSSSSVSDNNLFAYGENDPVNILGSSAVFGVIYLGVGNSLGYYREPSSDVGAASPYIDVPGSIDKTTPNCYAFAIGSPVNEQPGIRSGRIPSKKNDVIDMGKSVEADLKAMGYTVRKISGANAKVYDSEFKIAFRVGTESYGSDKYTDEPFYDYHFMRQTNTGQWAEKHGYKGSSILWDVGMTPDIIPWALNEEWLDYYNSAIIYYAVGK